MKYILCCLGMALCFVARAATPPEYVRGVYLLPDNYTERKVNETIHYAKHAGLNAVVLHVKDPRGLVYWPAQEPVAIEIGAVRASERLAAAVKRFKEAGLWTIAKHDMFQDTLLATKKPDWAVLNSKTGKPWENKDGLKWMDPTDTRVWDYNIALAKELVALGFNEIQFDYIRFPSDGRLAEIAYPALPEGKTRMDVIAQFLEKAKTALHESGALVSVDLFGFVAWREDDFGVGQRIEEFAPHVDAICPMLYPSHFPSGFLGKKNPGDFPREIMQSSMERMYKRTTVSVRPWIQAFWYTPEEINAQIDGLEAAGCKDWLIWNPSSNYKVTYQAFEQRHKTTFPPAVLYPPLEVLAAGPPRKLDGRAYPVHETDYTRGITMIRLQAPADGDRKYSTPAQALGTIDEAVMDKILSVRKPGSPTDASAATKMQAILNVLCADLDASPGRLSTRPMYVHWNGDCRFTHTPPAPLAEPQATQ